MKPQYPLKATNETGDVTVDIQGFTVPDSSITASSGMVNIATATGDVTGPASATNEAATVFDGTTGKTVKDGAAVNVLQKRAVESFTTTATAAGTTTLTVSSNPIQEFTGTTTQTVVLPVVTTLPKTGFKFEIINNSTGVVTVNSSGANLVTTIAGGSRATFVAVLLTGTTAASWAFTGGGNTPAIKEYAASIVGAGASNPTATEQWNTLGTTVAITRAGGGEWHVTAGAAVFTSAAKCNVQISSGRTAGPTTEGIISAVQWVSTTEIDLLLYDVAGAFADAASASANMPWSLKITVYP